MTSAMSTFDSTKEGLLDLLNEIHTGRIQLPDFQRGWIWDDDHIRSLLASVSLSYPIGAVLVMEVGFDGIRFKPRPVEGVSLANPPTPQRLILDGQQRLTSLYRALRCTTSTVTRDAKGKEIRRFYYLKIPSALDPAVDREEAIVSVPEGRVQKDFRGNVLLDVTTVDAECVAEMLPLPVVYDQAALTRWQMAYFHVHGMSHERLKQWNRLMEEVILRFQQYQVPLIELRRETPKEAVCQVFEKVNTGGVSLTVFELMTATFAVDNFSLRDDWTIRERQLKAHAPLRGVSSTDFLMAATLLATWRQRQADGETPVSCKRRDILRLILDQYQEVADPLLRGFKDAARLLIREHVFDAPSVPYQTQLVPLAAICAALGERFEDDPIKKKVARWYWCGVFGELYAAAVETRFAKDLPEVLGWLDGGSEPATVVDCNFAPQRLLGLRSRRSAAYKGLSALLMREGSCDFRTGDPVQLQDYFDDAIDLHHVFPKKVCGQMGIKPAQYNCVVNKTPLSARTNRIIGGNPPSIYLPRLQARLGLTESRLDEILESHMIQPDLVRSDNFEAFFEARGEALLGLIQAATGKPVARPAKEEEMVAEMEASGDIEEPAVELEDAAA